MAVYLVDFENVTSAGISGIQRLTKEDKVYIFYTANAANMSFSAHLNLLSSPAEITYYSVASGGKNALDFQLASFLGYLISKGEDKQFCIISNDRGYEYVRDFWERSGIPVNISINSASSVNKALMMFESPFMAKIQQNDAPAVSLDTVAAEKSADVQEQPAPEKEAKPIPKKRGRKPNITEKAAAPQKKQNVPKKAEGVPDILKNALAKADVTSEQETAEVLELMKTADGKQQFYRGILKIFGMEKGVSVYKAVRPEYTNLVKTVKQ